MTETTFPNSLPSLDPLPPCKETLPVSPKAVQALDRHALEQLGIPGEVLMENAASALARVALSMAGNQGRILILAGLGNNGGDGLAAHRLLAPRSSLYLIGSPDRLRGLALLQWQILANAGLERTADPEGNQAQAALSGLGPRDLVVDCLLGTGLDREVRGALRVVIEAVNDCPARVLAADIPSGLHGDDGRILGTAIVADATVTFAATKKGLYSGVGPGQAGTIYVAGIGIPAGSRDRFLAAWRVSE